MACCSCDSMTAPESQAYGAMAVIQPTDRGLSKRGVACKVLFGRQSSDDERSMSVTVRIERAEDVLRVATSKIMIHADGDLRLSGRRDGLQSIFEIPIQTQDSRVSGRRSPELSFLLDQPDFDLSIGNDKGIVARRVTVVDRDGLLCGDGVVGRL